MHAGRVHVHVHVCVFMCVHWELRPICLLVPFPLSKYIAGLFGDIGPSTASWCLVMVIGEVGTCEAPKDPRRKLSRTDRALQAILKSLVPPNLKMTAKNIGSCSSF